MGGHRDRAWNRTRDACAMLTTNLDESRRISTTTAASKSGPLSERCAVTVKSLSTLPRSISDAMPRTPHQIVVSEDSI